MEHIKAFFHKHPIESALLGVVGIIALYFAFKPAPASNGEAQLQQDYFAAEGIQAQSNAAVQVATINTGAQTAQTQIAANVSTANATTYANLDEAINTSNNNSAVAALPYAEESNLIAALSGVTNQTQSKSSSSSGFFGIGAGNSTTVTPTPAATNAANYLDELVNGLHVGNG